MSQPESRLSRAIMRALRAKKVWCMKIHGSEFVLAGAPDVIAVVEGRFLGLETKMPGGRLSGRQSFVHSQIRHAGGVVEVVHSVAEALAIVEAIRREESLRSTLRTDPPTTGRSP